MNWISDWIQGIIIAVVIGTIIEMILPDGNCKKYVKVVIGVYILFSIISPVITKITGNEFRVSDIFDIDTYIETSTHESQTKVETKQQDQIKQIYITNLKEDIKQKLKSKNYEVTSISVEIENNEQYTLKSMNLQVTQKEQTNSENREIQNVNEIKINIGNNSESLTKDVKISSKEQKELKEYLSGIYNLEEKNININ